MVFICVRRFPSNLQVRKARMISAMVRSFRFACSSGFLFLALAFEVGATEPPAMLAREVAPGAWYVEGLSALGSAANQNFISNAGFVVTDQGVVVVDALGSPALAKRLLEQIRRITAQPVKLVIVTHYHADHIYGLQAFHAAGARIVAHQAARDYLNSDTARLRLEASREELAPWVNEETQLVPADEWLAGDKEFDVGGVRFQIKPMGPSHTPEDLVVYLPQKKLLFAGDLVFRSRVPFVGQADSGHWIKALDALLAFDTTVIVPGHGPLSTSARADMELTRDYLMHLRTTMGQAARNMEPFEQAYQAADWGRFEHLPLFRVANRMNAYNTYLLMEREPQ
jgi:glyoxylase-like metal-dependent hydrolase (beta-lactamase superfamily II)